MSGKLPLQVFPEIKGVRLGSQDPLRQTNKLAVVGFCFGVICDFKLSFLREEEPPETVVVCYEAIAEGNGSRFLL